MLPSLKPLFVIFVSVFPTLLPVAARGQEEDAPRYELHEIPYGNTFAGLPVGTVVVEEMNNKRQVVGRYSYNDPGITTGPVIRLWVYLPAADYGLPAGFHLISTPGKRIEMASINDEGLVGGAVSNYGDTRRYLQAFTIKVDGSDYSEFNFTGTTDDSHIHDIANGGFVCGRAALTISPPANRGQNSHAFIRNPDQHSHANPFSPVYRQAFAYAINSQGNAAINFETATAGTIAALSDGASYTFLTPVPTEDRFRTFATDINEKNEVIGHHQSYYNTSPAGTFLSLPAPAYGLPAGFHVLPFSGDSSNNLGRTVINDHGLIATWRSVAGGFLWNRGTLHTFTEILPEGTAGIPNIVVRGLDNSGAILATRSFYSAGFLMLLPEEMEVITVNDDRDLQDHDPDDGVLDVDPDEEGEQITLRAAIDYANDRLGRQRIVFDIPGGGIPTIQLGFPPEGENVMLTSVHLPLGDLRISYLRSQILSSLKVTDPVEIDGSTQPGGWVELSGDQIDVEGIAAVNGLEIDSANCLVRGLVINRFPGVGIVLTGEGGNRVVGNRIGTDVSGTIAWGNQSNVPIELTGGEDAPYSGGLLILSSNNVIGGLTAADRNLLSGTPDYSDSSFYFERTICGDLGIRNPAAADNVILGNYIGTDVGGNKLTQLGFPSTFEYSPKLHDTGLRTRIGDGTAAGRNVICRAILDGSGTLVSGNHIGSNAAGTSGIQHNDLGNALLVRGSDILIQNNNIGSKVVVTSHFATGTTVPASDITFSGNQIGTVPVDEAYDRETISLSGTHGVTIGGTFPGQGNTIGHALARDFNRVHQPTIRAYGVENTNLVIVGNRFVPCPNDEDPNSMYNFTVRRVFDTRNDGTDPIDANDADGKQNYPRIITALHDDTTLRMVVELSTPFTGGTYHLDFYALSGSLHSGHGGKSMNYLGRATMVVPFNSPGVHLMNVEFPIGDAPSPGFNRYAVTATATRADGGSTSEFSKNVYTDRTPFADGDSDGISDEKEQSLGDRNGDGTADADQDHVASLQSSNGQPTTVEATPSTVARQATSGSQPRSGGAPHLENVIAETMGTLDAPRGYDYPHGLLTFEVANLSIGASVNIRLILTPEAFVETLWSLAPEGTWIALSNLTLGSGEVTVTLTDGGTGDRDGVANGRIVAALGPASALPTLAPPVLSIRKLETSESILLSWPAAASWADLEFSPDLSEGSWRLLTQERVPRLNGELREILWPLSSTADDGKGFFRLRER